MRLASNGRNNTIFYFDNTYQHVLLLQYSQYRYTKRAVVRVHNPLSSIQFVIFVHGVAMNAINEKELLEFVNISVQRNESFRIANFKIKETDDGRFVLALSLTWKEGEHILTSARKTPRVWAKLNTVAAFLRDFDLPNVPIFLELYYPEREP
jgi:hypothetical protein